jgi:intein/homing endonuclease
MAKKIGINVAARVSAVKPEGCFIPATKIKTNKGVFSLQEIFNLNGINLSEKYHEESVWYDLKENIKVYDMNNDEQNVTKLFINGIKDTLILEFEHEGKNTTVECTPNHKFFTKNRGWVEAKDLNEEDDIISY